MGGGGSYYDRDVTSSRLTSGPRGYSNAAESSFARSRANAAVLPKNRRLVSTCKSPIGYGFDETGSMGDLPKIIFDKWPMMAGELARMEYLEDPQVSLAAIGDVLSDSDPVQICDFSPIRKLDDWLSRLYLEGEGGGQHYESYEFIAYFYARLYDMENAVTPIFLFTGDESFRDQLYGAELRKHFGGEHSDVDAYTIFNELKKKFKRNVFLLHRRYSDPNLNSDITLQWEKILGKENVINLASDKAIADTTLGIFAIASGSRTLDEYIEDMQSRPLNLGGEKFKPQSLERIKEVRKSLELFASTRKPQPKEKEVASAKPTRKSNKPAGKISGRPKPDWKL